MVDVILPCFGLYLAYCSVDEYIIFLGECVVLLTIAIERECSELVKLRTYMRQAND